MQRSHRLGRPVVLIDNVQERAGLGLMEPVLRDRADGIADQVVLFATLRGYTHPALRNAGRRALPEVARHTGWEPGTSPSSRALLVALPPLTPDDTLHLVGGASQGLNIPPQLPHATHRLSGGSPLGVTLLAESARQNLPRGPGPWARCSRPTSPSTRTTTAAPPIRNSSTGSCPAAGSTN